MNTLKIVILSLIVIVGLSYITASKPISKVDRFPEFVSLLDQKQLPSRDVFVPNTLIAVANHDALSPLKEIQQIIKSTSTKNFIIVANTSSLPWMIKEFVITSKLQEMFTKDQNSTLIMDNDGKISLFLGHTKLHKTYYSLHFIDANKKIIHIADANVSDGDFDKKFSKEQTQTQFAHLIQKLQQI